MAARDQLDFVEVVSDRFAASPEALGRLRDLRETFTVIPHGLGLSVGSAGPLDREYLQRVKRVSEASQSPYYSDHLTMTHVPGIDLGQLAPVWFCGDVLRETIHRVDEIQNELGKPLVLENVTYLFEVPLAEMTQAEFFHRLVDATGCGVLLDVTNVFTNAVNHHFDPWEFIVSMPLESVVQVHLAGGVWKDGILMDSHSTAVPREVWQLFARLCRHADVKAVLLEYDQSFPDFGVLLQQVARARDLLLPHATSS